MPVVHDITQQVRELDGAVILKAAALCDGHGIVDPAAFHAVGLPDPIVRQLTVKHESDLRDPKATIYRDGQPVGSVEGVYGLDMLRFLAGSLGVTYRSCLGRGFQAQAIREALHDHVRRYAEPDTAHSPDPPR